MFEGCKSGEDEMKKSNNPGFEVMIRQRRRVVYKLRKDYHISYDETWRDIMFEVANELQLPLEHVERINTAWWKFVSEMMARHELVTIKMTYLFRIIPSSKKLRRYVDKMAYMVEGFYRKAMIGKAERDIEDVRRMEKHLDLLRDTYLRLEKEAAEEKRMRKERRNAPGVRRHPVVEQQKFLAVRMVTARKNRDLLNQQKNIV